MIIHALTNPLQHDTPNDQSIHELQRALHAAKLYHGTIDGVFGQGTASACKTAKWRLGYPKSAVKATGGQTLYDYLTGSLPLPPAFKIRRRLRGYGLSKNAQIRQAIVKWAHWGVEHTSQIHYQQSRPIDGHRHPGKLPLYTDCSGFLTDCYEWAKGPDPNGRRFDGQGYTGTMLDHGTTIPLYQAEPGDAVIWGYSPGHHTAVIVDVTNRNDPMIVSHGSEEGPLLERVSQEDAAQHRPRIVKRYLGI